MRRPARASLDARRCGGRAHLRGLCLGQGHRLDRPPHRRGDQGVLVPRPGWCPPPTGGRCTSGSSSAASRSRAGGAGRERLRVSSNVRRYTATKTFWVKAGRDRRLLEPPRFDGGCARRPLAGALRDPGRCRQRREHMEATLMRAWERPFCGSLRAADVGRRVELVGWVRRRRNLGGIVFVDLRDREGWVQVLARDELREAGKSSPRKMSFASWARWRRAPAETVNAEMPTGEVEVEAETVELLTAAGRRPSRSTDRDRVGGPEAPVPVSRPAPAPRTSRSGTP